MITLFIPSPPSNGFSLGPLTVRYYALCIVLGIIVALWLGNRRWKARGGSPETLEPVVLWAILAGVVGARLYHVITDYQLYFGPGRTWYRMFYIWEGGLGIWGAVALGAVVAAVICRRRRIKFWALADSLAPGIILAQGIGRLGNWFNQELFGRPTELPWGVMIDLAHRPIGYAGYATFHPAFLYELGWDVAACVILLLLDRRFRLGYGKVFWLYVAFYTAGRLPIEHLKIDPVNKVGGFRINEYTSVILLLVSVAILVWLFVKRPGRETDVDAAALGNTDDYDDAAASGIADDDGVSERADVKVVESDVTEDITTADDTDLAPEKPPKLRRDTHDHG